MAPTTRSQPPKARTGGRREAQQRNAPAPPAAERAGTSSPDGSPGLDALLTDAAVGRPGERWLPGVVGAKAAVKLARRPGRVGRRTARLAVEAAKIAAGRSEVAPAKGDRRFADPAWTGNPLFRRLGQAYLAAGSTAHELLDDAELGWGDERRLRFAVDNVAAALAPTNFPLTNPTVIKALVDTGGGNLARGTRQFVRDMARPPRIPTMVDRSSFTVGDNLALTPGAVVLRTPVFELIQYGPQTPKVREQPLLIVPPMINKYYIVDLAPERSLVEHLIKSGQQVFALSWRNPDERGADWSLDTYAGAVIEALDATAAITRSEKCHVLGLCAGGIVLSTVVAHLAARGEQDRLAGMTLAVCVLDNRHAGTTGAFLDRRVAALAVAESARRGYLDGRALAGVFAWLRPTDLIWNYWVNNYLLGKKPPAFDILYWNSDTTNMPAALHRDFIEMSLKNSLVRPGAMRVMGTPVDLTQITVDSYIVAGIADHITPWQNAHRTTQLLGSAPRFVLSNSGHIAAMVNPPGNPKASFRTHDTDPEDAAAWLEGATQHSGTWWDDWVKWLSQRSGEEKRPRRTLGAAAFKAMDPAPGTYVLNA
jgi:polyhydroxyalkanoate synthase subunit PhaC